MIRPGDVVIVSARSDMSMPEHKAEFIKFLDVYPHDEKPLKLLMLQRADLPLRFYRHTGHMYAREWGVKVAGNRNNRPRADMQQYVRDMALDQFSAVLRDTFEIEPRVEKVAPATFVLHRRGTEDVAHAIGAETQTNVLFTDFDNQPSLRDLAWYEEEEWLSHLRLPA